MQFAICVWNFEPTPETVADWHAQGVTALEPGATFLTTHSEAELERFGQLCRDAGIRIYTCHPPFGGEVDLSQLDEAARQKAIPAMIDSLRRARLLGAECAVIHPSSGYMTTEERPARQAQLMRSLEALTPAAQTIGIRLAIENMLPDHLGDHSAEVWHLAEYFDLGICFDTGHAHVTTEGVMSAWATLRERIITVHLQDNDRNADRHLQPPYGTIHWPPLVEALRNGSFDFPWSVEATPWNGASYRQLLNEMHALFTNGLLTIFVGGQTVNVLCTRCRHYLTGTPDAPHCACVTRS